MSGARTVGVVAPHEFCLLLVLPTPTSHGSLPGGEGLRRTVDGPTLPAAAAIRLNWPEIPERVRAAVEVWCGGPSVSAAASQSAGSSPGVGARLRTADGRRVFAKAMGPEPNPLAPEFHRHEARVAAVLSEEVPVPGLLFWGGSSAWRVVHFGAVGPSRSQ